MSYFADATVVIDGLPADTSRGAFRSAPVTGAVRRNHAGLFNFTGANFNTLKRDIIRRRVVALQFISVFGKHLKLV